MPQIVEFSVFRGSSSGEIVPGTIRRDLKPTEVFLDISHAGLCGTDRLFKEKEVVLGHEGAGTVRDIGSAVTHLKPGDRVGFGWVQKVCGHCDYCLSGKDQYCDHRKQYGSDFEIGSFATHAVFDVSMLIKLPDELELEYAAPLMCGGATVWEALTSYDAQPGDRVAIQGIGGLGHLAIQFASALGYEVVALSSSPQKKDEAIGLGAKEFHVLKNGIPETSMAKVKHLFWCGNAVPEFSKILSFVANEGVVYPLTISSQSLQIPVLALDANGIRVQGSAVASRLAIRKMLRFVVVHRLRPIIMSWPMTKDGIQAAFKTLEDGKMRYRGVLVSQRYLMGKPVVEKMK